MDAPSVALARPLADDADADEREAEQDRVASVESGFAVIREHLQEYIQRNPDASYESWIATLHPENVQLDTRLLNRGNPWLVVWGEAGALARVKEIRGLHGCLTLASGAWAGLCICMHVSGQNVISGTTHIMGTSTFLSVVLFFLQALTLVSAFYFIRRDKWPLQVYKVTVLQLLLQTCVTIMSLTSFIFHEHGLSILDCLSEDACETSLKGRGFENDSIQWSAVSPGKLTDGPFMSVVIDVMRQRKDGTRPPTVHLTSKGETWDGIRVQAAMPFRASYPAGDKAIIYMALTLYFVAIVITLLYVITYRRLGQSHLLQSPPWLSLKRMEVAACILCFLLILMNLCGFVLHMDAEFVGPGFVGIALFVALVQKLISTIGRRRPLTGPFNSWQKRTVTTECVVVMVAFTYMAGLCVSFVLCSGADVWPSNLQSSGVRVIMCGSFLHLLLSTGYGVSLWFHLRLARLRTASQSITPSLVEAGRVSATAQGPQNAGQARCSQQSVSSAPAESMAASPAPAFAAGSALMEETECIVCMDEFRDTVIVPCGHFAMCKACASNVMRSQRPLCPICTSAVDDICRVYNA